MLMRSQLDCRDERLPRKIFDLKTRATFPVRLDVANYKDHLDYRITRTTGLFYSFEREYYDMMRSAFLKYSMQVRIGGMDGIMVAYHNTSEIFGFQYIRLEEMDTALFGNSYMGDAAFGHTVQILDALLNRIVDLIPNRTLRVHIQTLSSGTMADVYAWTEDRPEPPPAAAPAVTAAGAAGEKVPVTVINEDEVGAVDADAVDAALGVAGAGAGAAAAGAASAAPPPSVPDKIIKLRMVAHSIVNGAKTETPFVRRQGTDVWNVSFRIDVRAGPALACDGLGPALTEPRQLR